MKIGVLALQGAVPEHLKMVEQCGSEAVAVKTSQQLTDLDGLIIPGGESTTIGKLMDRYSLLEPIKEKIQQGMPVFGTCAGLILLAREIKDSEQIRLGLMDIEVQRNAFGSQRESFEADLEVESLGREPFRAVFIRAPYISQISGEAEVLARFEDKTVAARQGNILVAAFHPELTDDLRMHKYFIEMAKKS